MILTSGLNQALLDQKRKVARNFVGSLRGGRLETDFCCWVLDFCHEELESHWGEEEGVPPAQWGQ